MSVQPILEVVIAASNYDLVGLDVVKDELRIDPADTTSDEWLARAITQVSVLAQNYVKRPFAVETLRETIYIDQDPYPYQTPGGVAPLQLKRWPLQFVGDVSQTIASGMTQTLQANKDYVVDFDLGHLIRLNPFTGVSTTWEALPVMVLYDAGYNEIPPDVVDAALRLIVNRWHSRGRDPLLLENVQPGVGTQRWWVGGPKGGGTLPAEVQGMLDIYRVPSHA
jgi:hypothetical protein